MRFCYVNLFAVILFSLSLWSGLAFAQLGDFDGDGAWNCADIDALTAEILAQSNNVSFDLNGDALVDANDASAWLALAGAVNLDSGLPYYPGDGNLDGSVDVSDFMIWNANKFTSNSAWCSADFNFDGAVDVRDFNWWNDFKFLSAGRLVDTSADPSPIDDAVEFVYDAASGVMSIDPNGLEIWCFSVFGVSPQEFLLNGAGNVDPNDTIWIQDFFAGHAKWFSLDVSSVDATAIALFEPGLTADDFDYVEFGTPDALMGRGTVTIVNGTQVVPEPATFAMLIPLLVALRSLLGQSRKRGAR